MDKDPSNPKQAFTNDVSCPLVIFGFLSGTVSEQMTRLYLDNFHQD